MKLINNYNNCLSKQFYKKNRDSSKAQIGYTYEDSTTTSFQNFKNNNNSNNTKSPILTNSDDENEDLDIALDIHKLTPEHKVILNKCATNYGMQFGDYIRMLILENEEKEEMKRNKLLEAEKAQYLVSFYFFWSFFFYCLKLFSIFNFLKRVESVVVNGE